MSAMTAEGLPTIGRWFDGDIWGDIKKPGARWELVLDLARDCVTHPARGWSSIAVPDEERPQTALWDECRSLADTLLRATEEEEDGPGPDLIAAALEAIIMDFARREDDQRTGR